LTTAIFDEIRQLGERLVADNIDVTTELTIFPSGNAMLDVRRAERAFVLAYFAGSGFGVDEIYSGDGLGVGYRFVFSDFESAASHLQKMTAAELSPKLSLVVVHAGNVELTKDFYAMLGLDFCEEQHGTGPRHYAATLGALAFEIYPRSESFPGASMRVGFEVPFLDRTYGILRNRGVPIVSEPKDSPWGRRMVVKDPDGNRVELTESRRATATAGR